MVDRKKHSRTLKMLHRCAKEGCETQVDGGYCLAHVPRPGVGRVVDRGVDPVVERVVTSFQERSAVGQRTYGTTLARTDLTTLQWIQHLQEELMDAVLYLERLKDEVE